MGIPKEVGIEPVMEEFRKGTGTRPGAEQSTKTKYLKTGREGVRWMPPPLPFMKHSSLIQRVVRWAFAGSLSSA